MAYFLQQLLNAVPVASLYACLAFGYALAFGVTRRPDITFGAIVAFAGQMSLLFVEFGWTRLYLVLPAALILGLIAGFAYAVLAGWTSARYVMLPLHRQSPNSVIVASLGLVILLSESARLALDARSLWLPPLWPGQIVFAEINGFAIGLTGLHLLHSILMILMVLVGHRVLARSRTGLSWQAVCQDPVAARMMGLDADRVFVGAFVTAAAYAAIAGLSATALYGTMDFGAGLMLGLKVVLIAAAGGSVRPLHSAVGAAGIGLSETLWSAYGPMIWRDAIIIAALVGLLIFGRRVRITP